MENEVRKCNCCNEPMKKGYCINGGEEYFCSDECLDTKYSSEAWELMYDDGNSDSYYTEWESIYIQ